MRLILTSAAALALALLASCGGGSETGGCNSVGIMPVTTRWTVVGGEYNPARYQGQTVVGKAGVALSAKPVHQNEIPECVGKGVYSLGSAAQPLPAGLALNTATGEISGTPTAAGDVGSVITATVRMDYPGLTSFPVLTRLVVEN